MRNSLLGFVGLFAVVIHFSTFQAIAIEATGAQPSADEVANPFARARDADDLIIKLAARRDRRTNDGEPASKKSTAAPTSDVSPEEGPDDPNAVDTGADTKTSVQPDPASEANKPAAVVQPAAPTNPLIQTVITYANTEAPKTLKDYSPDDLKAAADFYSTHTGPPLWVDSKGFTAKARMVVAELRRAGDWGLNIKDYKILELASAINDSGTIEDEDLPLAELEMSLNVLAYARHARGGRIEDPATQLSSYLDRKPQLLPPKEILDSISVRSDPAGYLRSLHPAHPQFEKLRQVLLSLRAETARAELDKVPPSGPNLKPGTKHESIPVFRRRLGVKLPVTTDSSSPDPEVYDSELEKAVISFQDSRNLSPAKGVINKATRRALNRDERLSEDQVLANMEAWRWMPANLGSPYVWVNIPEFMVRVVKHDQYIHEERVVTGTTEKQTPIFSHSMRTVVLWPYWIVPNSIKVRELWPRIATGGDPIAGRGLKLMRNGKAISTRSVNWGRSDIRNYDVVQPPGPGNALGVVKFLFPNKHSVYLHDTPSKGLFNASQRAFSHGCVRVRNPVRLAEVLLGEDKGLTQSDVAALLKQGPEDNKIALDKKIPVHLTYFTVWVDDQNRVRSFDDIYGHEKRIKLALAGRWNAIQKNRDHLLPADPGEIARYAPQPPKPPEELGDDDDERGLFYTVLPNGMRGPPAYIRRSGQDTSARYLQPPSRRSKGVGDDINRALGGAFFD